MPSRKKQGRLANSNRPQEVMPRSPQWWAAAGTLWIAGLVLLSYWPAIQGGFLLDDDLLLTANPLVKAPDGLYRIWFTKEAVDYWPVTNSAFWVQWRLFGTNPTGYHVTNLLVHVANCLLIWLLLARLRISGAFLAAVLYAVHPVNVEGVAWISQLKNVLSLLFFLLALLAFVKAEEPAWLAAESSSRRPTKGAEGKRSAWNRWHWLSLLVFTLAMLSKGSVAILPLVLLLIVWFRTRSIGIGDVWRTAPFFAVSVIFTLVNICFQASHTVEAIRTVSFLQRFLGAGAVVWFYLYKAVLPVNLVFVYPQWNIDPSQIRWWLPLLSALLATWALWRSRTIDWVRAVLFAWTFFCVALLPVMGFTEVGFMRYSLVADHYQYITIIGVVAMVAAGWHTLRLAGQPPQRSRWWLNVTAFMVVGVLSLLSWRQSQLYAGPVTLYRATLEENPESWAIQSSFGEILIQEGQTENGIEHLEKAIELHPDSSAEINNMIGTALENAGRYREGIERFQQAIASKPGFAVPYNNLAWLLATTPDERFRDAAQAVELAKKATQLDSTLPGAFNTLGIAEYRAGNWQEAIRWLEKSAQSEGGGTAFDWFFLVMAEQRVGNQAKARADFIKGKEWMQQYAPRNGELNRLRLEAETVLNSE